MRLSFSIGVTSLSLPIHRKLKYKVVIIARIIITIIRISNVLPPRWISFTRGGYAKVFLQLMDIKKSTERDAGRAGSNGLMGQVGQDDIWGLWRVVDVEIFGDLRGANLARRKSGAEPGAKRPRSWPRVCAFGKRSPGLGEVRGRSQGVGVGSSRAVYGITWVTLTAATC